MNLLPSVVMTDSHPDPCPWCEAECEWRFFEDAEAWRLFCCDCGAELEREAGTELL